MLTHRPWRPGVREDYMADCQRLYHHWPPCGTPRFCGFRRELDAAVRDRRVTVNDATRLLRHRLQDGGRR